jgi:crotonobetainyl-CoA:carnitine CoA-transferase CaiB-like acyl-CoA transferase
VVRTRAGVDHGKTAPQSGPRPLEGLIVLDATQVIAGPIAAMLLADYGARVIKVEHPVRGDSARRLGVTGAGRWWPYLSRGKECITCDLSRPEGAALFRRLAAKADVVIESFRPGTMEKWGVGYDTLSTENPGLVMLRVSGFGQDGPFRDRPGYGALAEAMGGLVFTTGQVDGPPTLPGVPVADPLTGALGAAVTMMCLWARDRPGGNGKGCEIDLALYGSMLYMLGHYIAETSQCGVAPARGAQLGRRALRGVTPCADGRWVVYSIIAPSLLEKAAEMVRGLGFYDAEGPPGEDVEKLQALDRAMRAFAASRPRDEVLARLAGAGVPNSPVNSVEEILSDPLFAARGDLYQVQRGELETTMPRPPARLGGRAITPDDRDLALGADNLAVYGDLLGLNEDECGRLQQLGAI